MSRHEHIEPEPSLAAVLDGLLAFLTRRRWWILLIGCFVTLATVGVVLRLENRYTSEATLVMQKKVLHQYVLPASATAGPELVQAMAWQVMSRANLIDIIDRMGLYAEHKEKGARSDDLVGLMRKDIQIQSLDRLRQTDSNAFEIAFTADDPQVAQMVTGRLTQLFIDENLETRENVAANTSKFLTEQLATAKQKLLQHERRLRAFQARHPNAAAVQQAVNTSALTELRLQLQATRSALRRAEQQRAAAESSILQILARLKDESAQLLVRYTPRHPEVVRKQAEVANAMAVLKFARGETPSAARPQLSAIPGDASLAEATTQVEIARREMQELSAEELRLRSEIQQIQNRLAQAPVREQEFAALLHEYDLLKQQYTELQNRQQQSLMTTNLEAGGDSVRFQLIDPPSLPRKPSSPKRLQISLAGAAAGVLLGLGLAWLVDSRDRSFRSVETLRQSFSAPLVVDVPVISTPTEQFVGKLKRVLEWAAAFAVVVAVLGAELYVYRHG